VRAIPGVMVVAALTVLALMLVPAGAAAKPDFSKSTIAVDPAAPKEGDVVTFLVHIRNTGDEPAPFTEVEFELPLEAMFVDATGLEGLTGAKVDPLEKLMAATLDLPPGAGRTFSVRMVIPHDAGGHALIPRLKVRYAHAGVEFYGGGDPVTIDTRVANTGAVFGGIRFHPAAFVLLGVLLLYPALRVLTGSRKGTKGPVLMIVIAVGFLSIFAAMAWHDWRTAYAFPKVSCTVLDTRMRVNVAESRTSLPKGPRREYTTNYEPLIALRYLVADREVIGTGYSTSSRLDIGRSETLIRDMDQFKIGAEVPCWYDPSDPTRVVVRPGFGGAYMFVLLPLGLLFLGLWGLVPPRQRSLARGVRKSSSN
jgi:uncharacterized repeat protein (TIGR01451 family)